MDFHELEAFVRLASTLHFGRAAAAVHTSPSALSRLLGRLEEELGARLLARDTRRVALTEQGAAFLVFAEESLRRRDELHLQLSSGDGKLRGTLRVYASVTACYSILPPFIEAMGRIHSELRLSVETGDPAGAERTVREASSDIALGALPPGGFSGLDCFSVRRTPLVFVASKKGQWGKLDSIQENIADIPLILPREGLARDRFERWISNKRVKPLISAETAGNEALLALARLGLGIGLIPRLVLENSPFADGLVLYEAGPDFGDYDIGFVMSRPRSPAGKALSHAMRGLLADVYTGGSWVGENNG